MKKLIATAMLAAGLFAAMPASADPINVADAAYVDDSDTSVWQETNGRAGLQKVADDDGASDTLLADL